MNILYLYIIQMIITKKKKNFNMKTSKILN